MRFLLTLIIILLPITLTSIKMVINQNTKIASLLKQHPDALEAIISLSARFEKLRNPILRRIMAGRTSIAMAAKMGGCSVEDFFNRLSPLGFKADQSVPESNEKNGESKNFSDLFPGLVTDLDVRPLIETGKDPLNSILNSVNQLPAGHALKIINSFEPVPLVMMLEKKGFRSSVYHINDNLVETYFYRESPGTTPLTPESFKASQGVEGNKKNPGGTAANTRTAPIDQDGFHSIIEQYRGRFVTIDVREMEMPQPMMTILESLENLPEESALFVHHKRIPVFLLPELEERNFDYRANEISEGNVELIIFRKGKG